jgi:hypothetical protein
MQFLVQQAVSGRERVGGYKWQLSRLHLRFGYQPIKENNEKDEQE